MVVNTAWEIIQKFLDNDFRNLRDLLVEQVSLKFLASTTSNDQAQGAGGGKKWLPLGFPLDL